MLEFLLMLIPGVLVIMFVHVAVQQDMILDFLPKIFKRIKNEDLRLMLAKPLFACVVCMASVWGTVTYLLLSESFIYQEWVAYCMCLSGLMFLFINFLPFELEFLDLRYYKDNRPLINYTTVHDSTGNTEA